LPRCDSHDHNGHDLHRQGKHSPKCYRCGEALAAAYVLQTAVVEGQASLLLDVQQDCVALRKRGEELERVTELSGDIEAAERERCAKVVERLLYPTQHAAIVAAAIRAGG